MRYSIASLFKVRIRVRVRVGIRIRVVVRALSLTCYFFHLPRSKIQGRLYMLFSLLTLLACV